MAPTSEAGLLPKDDTYADGGVCDATPISPSEPTQYLGDLDNSCETFFCRRNSPLLSRLVIPEPSSTFRKVLGDMDKPSDNCLDDDDSDDDDGQEYIWKSNGSNSSSKSSLTASSNSKSKAIPAPSRKLPSSHSNFLSVPSSLPSFISSSHADSSDYGAHKTLAGLALRKNTSRRPSSFGGSDSVKPEARLANHREKRVSWADERGTQRQLISVRLIRPRLSMDASIGVSAAPLQSILRRQDQLSSVAAS